jgi:hypothetical protein
MELAGKSGVMIRLLILKEEVWWQLVVGLNVHQPQAENVDPVLMFLANLAGQEEVAAEVAAAAAAQTWQMLCLWLA